MPRGKTRGRRDDMELGLLLFPVAILLGVGITHFPVVTGIFLVYLVALAARLYFGRAESEMAPDKTV
jgi:hypothetical protein